MTPIGPIPNPMTGPPAAAGRVAENHPAPPTPTAPTDDLRDRVDWSPQAADDIPSPDMEKRIAEVRRQIADDSYVTPDKIDVVVERLHDLLTRP